MANIPAPNVSYARSYLCSWSTFITEHPPLETIRPFVAFPGKPSQHQLCLCIGNLKRLVLSLIFFVWLNFFNFQNEACTIQKSSPVPMSFAFIPVFIDNWIFANPEIRYRFHNYKEPNFSISLKGHPPKEQTRVRKY